VAQLRHHAAPTANIPDRDATITLRRMTLFDFVSNRMRIDGESHHAMLNEKAGQLSLLLYKSKTTAAFDGRTFMTLSPKELSDPASVPDGIKYPVEFRESVITDPSKISLELQNLPLLLANGAVLAPDVEVTAKQIRPEVGLTTWKELGRLTHDGHDAFSIVSPPSNAGNYIESVIRPDLQFRPVTWTSKNATAPSLTVDIKYDSNGSIVAPASWVMQYYADGRLSLEVEAVVDSYAANPTMDDAQFKLQPKDGMVIERQKDGGTDFTVAGQPRLSAPTNYALNRTLAAQRAWTAWIIVPVAIIVSILVSAVAYWMRRQRA